MDEFIFNNEIIIRNYLGEIIEEVDLAPLKKAEGISCFLHTLIDFLYIEYGFEKPIDVRTFLGKSAKGKLSYRKEIVSTILIKESKKNDEIKIYKSVNHEIFIYENKFIISFLPNYEIYGNLFDLPLNFKDRKLIERDSKWSSLVFLNPKKFFDRFEEYRVYIFNKLKGFNFITELEINSTYDSNSFIYPNAIYVNFLNQNIDLNKDISFEENLLKFFKNNLKLIPIIEIEVIVDNFKLQDNLESNKILEDYLKKLEDSYFFKIKVIKYIDNIDEFNFSNNYPYLVLINDKHKGSEYFYAAAKRKAEISKAINISTLEIIEDFGENLLLIWLALNFRSNKNLIWFFDNPPIFKKIISFGVNFDPDFEVFKISGVIFNTASKNLMKFKDIFFRSSINQEREDILNDILTILEKKYKFEYINELFLFEQGNFSEDFIKILKDKSYCVLIKRPNTRIFHHFQNKHEIPKNGSYIQLFSNTTNSYLLINTGFPDTPENGLPNPLLVKIISELDEIKAKDILQIIFNLTFYQTESFSKVNLPFLIRYKNKDLFNKIPYKYNEESPF